MTIKVGDTVKIETADIENNPVRNDMFAAGVIAVLGRVTELGYGSAHVDVIDWTEVSGWYAFSALELRGIDWRPVEASTDVSTEDAITEMVRAIADAICLASYRVQDTVLRADTTAGSSESRPGLWVISTAEFHVSGALRQLAIALDADDVENVEGAVNRALRYAHAAQACASSN